MGRKRRKRKHKMLNAVLVPLLSPLCCTYTLNNNYLCHPCVLLQDSSLSVLQQELVNKVEGGPAPIDPQVAKRRAIRKGAR